MSSTSTHLSLTLPDPTDVVDITVINANMDTIDAAFGPTSGGISTNTVSNTTGEGELRTLTIPAASASLGYAYQIRAVGQVSTTGTPNLTFRLRIGGLTGTVIATIGPTATGSSISGKNWAADGFVVCVTSGASATWLGGVTLINEIAGSFPVAAVAAATSAQTKDSTVSNVLILTAQWGTASASNTISCYSAYAHKVTNH